MSIFKRGPKPTTPTLTTPDVPKFRAPTAGDVEWHYRSAQFWLTVAEQPGRGSTATTAAASCSQAHAALGQLAHLIMWDHKNLPTATTQLAPWDALPTPEMSPGSQTAEGS